MLSPEDLNGSVLRSSAIGSFLPANFRPVVDLVASNRIRA